MYQQFAQYASNKKHGYYKRVYVKNIYVRDNTTGKL